MTKILLVEDDKSLREIYGVRLLAEGYDIISAGDGEAALAMAIKDRPALIVSDVMMPKISGFDMLDILRSTTETRDIKVIMMTALSSEDQRQRGVELGADKYLVKSQVGIEDVVNAVHEVLGDAPHLTAGAEAQPANQSQSQQVTPAQQPFVPPATAPAQQIHQPPTPSAPAAPQQPPQMPQPAPPAPVHSPAPSPSPSTLPQPTAPFSTPRTGNLATRVIQPLERESPGETGHLASQIDRELGGQSDSLAPAAPQQPPQMSPPAPQPTPPALSQNETPLDPPIPQAMPQAPEPSTPQTPTAQMRHTAQAPSPNPLPADYEETPRN